jgi:trans-2,3-dihydro-3-hydroxyanthranilate isomerase
VVLCASTVERMLEYQHVDVFTGRPYAGNSLAVFLDQQSLTAAQMLAVTQELRHFESIFLTRAADGVVDARIFDLIEELPFAGHPTIGAAAVLHQVSDATSGGPLGWRLRLAARTVTVNNDGRTEDVAHGSAEHVQEVTVSGEVSFVGTGRLDVVPTADTGSRS